MPKDLALGIGMWLGGLACGIGTGYRIATRNADDRARRRRRLLDALRAHDRRPW